MDIVGFLQSVYFHLIPISVMKIEYHPNSVSRVDFVCPVPVSLITGSGMSM